MNYRRVIPRDFFNESKLFKCLGQLSLCILDNKLPYELTEELEDEYEGFQIHQDVCTGDVYCSNYHVYLGETELCFYSLLNSKLNYSLMCETVDDDDDIFVFNDDGTPTQEFLRFLESLRY